MSLPIAGEDLRHRIANAIRSAVPDSTVDVTATNPGHFELRVVSATFAGKNRLEQHQMVFGAIAELMRGDDAPVHAIDRLQTLVP